jgi:hypothetical protein
MAAFRSLKAPASSVLQRLKARPADKKQAWTGRSTLQPAGRPALQSHAFAGWQRRWRTKKNLPRAVFAESLAKNMQNLLDLDA